MIAIDRFSSDEPSCYEQLRERFGGPEWKDSDDVISWDGVIYARNLPLPEGTLVHERVHLADQAAFEGGPEAYLEKYLHDREFRKQTEVKAYTAQLQYIGLKVAKNQSELAVARSRFAMDLSLMYDLGITHFEALELLPKI